MRKAKPFEGGEAPLTKMREKGQLAGLSTGLGVNRMAKPEGLAIREGLAPINLQHKPKRRGRRPRSFGLGSGRPEGPDQALSLDPDKRAEGPFISI